MNYSRNKYDSLESIIFKDGLRVVGVHCYPELDLSVYILNNKNVLLGKISSSARLKDATPTQLRNHVLFADGVGVHWPDVDISL